MTGVGLAEGRGGAGAGGGHTPRIDSHYLVVVDHGLAVDDEQLERRPRAEHEGGDGSATSACARSLNGNAEQLGRLGLREPEQVPQDDALALALRQPSDRAPQLEDGSRGWLRCRRPASRPAL